MKWKHRNFDCKSNEECQEHPVLNVARQPEFHQFQNIKSECAGNTLVVEIKCQDTKQHQNGTEEGVQEKFDCRVKLSWSAPNADQEVHRHQHHFPENVEQHKIKRDKYTDHPCLQKQHEHVIFFEPGCDCAP